MKDNLQSIPDNYLYVEDHCLDLDEEGLRPAVNTKPEEKLEENRCGGGAMGN